MADTIETGRTSWTHRFRYTPWRDVLRGRLTGRLDWPAALNASGLPAPARELIARVVRRTRLWPAERADVTRELIAHFADGLAAGVPLDVLLADFGDPVTAAKLIRRAKLRNRSWVWTVRRWFYRGLAAVALLYVGVIVRYFTGGPTPTVDYVAELNRPVLAIPEADRAWPLYVQAHKQLEVEGRNEARAAFQDALQHPPGGPDEAAITAWVAGHGEGIETLRRAAAKPALGFVYGPGGSAGDVLVSQRNRPATGALLLDVLLPHVNDTRYFAQCLHADARAAAGRGDGRRVVNDVRTMMAMQEQIGRPAPFLVCAYVQIGVQLEALECVAETLAARPEALDDTMLVELAHLFAGPKVAADLVSFDAERRSFADLLQHLYTDDGHGDGRLTAAGMRWLIDFSQQALSPESRRALEAISGGAGGAVLMPGLALTHASRREAADAITHYFDAAAANLARPLREVDRDAVRRNDEILLGPWRTGLIGQFLPSVSSVGTYAERCLGRREGVMVGLALELYRRRHGAYPATLAELSPRYLPSLPVDRITGEALHYKLADGKPLVYSVGFDRVDNGGRAVTRAGEPVDYAAAEWPPADKPGQVTPRMAGDWVVYAAGPLTGMPEPTNR